MTAEKDTEEVDVVRFVGRDDILLFDDRQYETVEVPEWSPPGEPPALVRIRGLTGAERDSWEASIMKENDPEAGRGRTRVRLEYSELRSKLVVRCIVDAEGNRIFSDADARKVSAKSASAIQRIFERCQKLSRLTDEDVDELVKGSSGPTQNGAAGSTSPTTSESP